MTLHPFHPSSPLLRGGCLSPLIMWAAGIAAAFILCLLSSGCTPRMPEFITVPEIHDHWHVQRDTVLSRDTVWEHERITLRPADSAALAVLGIAIGDMRRAWIVEHDRLRREVSLMQASRTDTILQRDTVTVTVPSPPVVKEVRAPLAWWERTLMGLGVAAVLAAALFALWQRARRRLTSLF